MSASFDATSVELVVSSCLFVRLWLQSSVSFLFAFRIFCCSPPMQGFFIILLFVVVPPSMFHSSGMFWPLGDSIVVFCERAVRFQWVKATVECSRSVSR